MQQFDLIVIGAGPGGYIAAIRAAQLGMHVACVDKNARLGGTCARVGCIPSKALLESSERYEAAQHALSRHGIHVGEVSLDLPTMLRRKDQVVHALTTGVAALLKKNSVEHFEGVGHIASPGNVIVEADDGPAELTAPRILIATGSVSASLPGVQIDADRIGTSTEALTYDQVPEHLVVIGAGYIGLELGTVWQRLGARVTVLEFLDRILPGTDTEIATEAQKIFTKQGLKFQLGSRVTGATANGERCVVECDGADPIDCDPRTGGRRQKAEHRGARLGRTRCSFGREGTHRSRRAVSNIRSRSLRHRRRD